MTLHVNCPTCHKDIPWTEEFPYRPFCSKRCRLIDLGQWADESHRIPGDKPVRNDDEPDHDS